MEYNERPPYQRAEVSHEMSRAVTVSRNTHDLNLPSHQVDSRTFNNRLDTSNQNQHSNFEDIGSSIMGTGRDPHGRTPLGHQRLEPHFEERKSNHIEIDESRNPNRINSNQ